MYLRAVGGTQVANRPELFIFSDPDLHPEHDRDKEVLDKARIGTAALTCAHEGKQATFSTINNYVVSILIRNKHFRHK